MKVTTCRLCLAVEVKGFELGNTAEKSFIEDILKKNGFGQPLFGSHFICYECKALLEKSYKFIQKVLIAQRYLVKKMKKNKGITLDSLKGIDRRELGFASSLTTHVMKKIDILAADVNTFQIEKSDFPDIVKEEIDNNDSDIEVRDGYVIIEEGIHIDDSQIEVDGGSGIEFEKSDGLTDNKDIDSEIDAIDDLEQNQCIDSIVKKRTKYNKDDDYLPLSSKTLITGAKKEKDHKIKTIVTGNVDKPVKKKYSKYLVPSKFIQSLANVGDKCERRINKSYAGLDSNFNNGRKTDDEDFEVESSEDSSSSQSDCDEYDDNGKRLSKPIRIRKYPRPCDHCEYIVPEGRDHHRHYLKSHPDKQYPYPRLKEKFVCQFCGKISKGYSAHRYHELTHSNKKMYSCKKCPKSFHNCVLLYRHTYCVHPKRLLECDYCSKKFKTRLEITRHMRTHTGEKPFKCHICGAGFAHSGNVGIHIRSNHGYVEKSNKKTKISTKRKRERKQ